MQVPTYLPTTQFLPSKKSSFDPKGDSKVCKDRLKSSTSTADSSNELTEFPTFWTLPFRQNAVPARLTQNVFSLSYFLRRCVASLPFSVFFSLYFSLTVYLSLCLCLSVSLSLSLFTCPSSVRKILCSPSDDETKVKMCRKVFFRRKTFFGLGIKKEI